ncbi:hypothetical protein SS50377_22312 [Spironucleus salmonicida]|uniref:Uncharacterized protein n=1 Tax=Spironucleus salmonicida TaxID=348837 RepID=V6LN98_9EUKA|nr:hypothetical protein SS50377_22312 [Spironucleus salmonicida]|eukprot:EST42194.1 Hypothetical protein SS50377_18498 [Spironucleus salmonicida]
MNSSESLVDYLLINADDVFKTSLSDAIMINNSQFQFICTYTGEAEQIIKTEISRKLGSIYGSIHDYYQNISDCNLAAATQLRKHQQFFNELEKEKVSIPPMQQINQTKIYNSALQLESINLHYFQHPASDQYIASKFRLALTSYRNCPIPHITLNEFPLLLSKCYQVALKIFNLLKTSFAKNDISKFLLLLSDDLSSPNSPVFEVFVKWYKTYSSNILENTDLESYLLNDNISLFGLKQMDATASVLLKLCFLVLSQNYKLVGYEKGMKSLENVGYDVKNCYFLVEKYVEELEDGEIEPLQFLLGESDNTKFLDEAFETDDTRAFLIFPAIVDSQNKLIMEGKMEFQITKSGQIKPEIYVESGFFDDINTNKVPLKFDHQKNYQVNFQKFSQQLRNIKEKIKGQQHIIESYNYYQQKEYHISQDNILLPKFINK